MYGLYGSQYIYRSVDAGESWDSVYNYNTFLDLVIDNNDQIFAVGPGKLSPQQIMAIVGLHLMQDSHHTMFTVLKRIQKVKYL